MLNASEASQTSVRFFAELRMTEFRYSA